MSDAISREEAIASVKTIRDTWATNPHLAGEFDACEAFEKSIEVLEGLPRLDRPVSQDAERVNCGTPPDHIWVHPWREMLYYSPTDQPDYIEYVRATAIDAARPPKEPINWKEYATRYERVFSEILGAEKTYNLGDCAVLIGKKIEELEAARPQVSEDDEAAVREIVETWQEKLGPRDDFGYPLRPTYLDRLIDRLAADRASVRDAARLAEREEIAQMFDRRAEVYESTGIVTANEAALAASAVRARSQPVDGGGE